MPPAVDPDPGQVANPDYNEEVLAPFSAAAMGVALAEGVMGIDVHGRQQIAENLA